MTYIEFVFATRDKSTVILDSGDFYNFLGNLALPDNRVYHLAMDQSTTCTGLCIADSKFQFQFLCNLHRKYSSPEDYFRDLKNFLKSLAKDRVFATFLTERIPPIRSASYASLASLKTLIRSWRADIPEFKAMSDDRFDDILPQVWKSKIVDKSKSKHRHRVKKFIAEDICDLFPELSTFFSMQTAKDYDAFDACGILHGYFRTKNVEDHLQVGTVSGLTKRISAEKNYRGDIIAFYKMVNREDVSNPAVVLEDFEYPLSKAELEVMALNEDKSMYDNILMAGSYKDFVLTQVGDWKTQLAIRWQFNLGLENKTLLCFIMKKRILSSKVLEYLKSKYPYEEIYDGG